MIKKNAPMITVANKELNIDELIEDLKTIKNEGWDHVVLGQERVECTDGRYDFFTVLKGTVVKKKTTKKVTKK